MTEVHDIRKLYFEEGQSITQISRQTGRDRKTIRMYLGKEDWNEITPKSLPEDDFPKLEPFKADIDAWLTEDKKPGASRGILPSGFMTGWEKNTREALTALIVRYAPISPKENRRFTVSSPAIFP